MSKINWKKLVLFVVSLFLIWNLLWYLVMTIKYHPSLEAVPKNQFGVHSKEIDGYVYNVKKPGYFSLTGNLGLSNRKAWKV